MVRPRLHFCWAVFVVLIASSSGLAQSSLPFSMATGGSTTFAAEKVSGPLNTGFARIQTNPGTTVPEGFAIFQSRAGGIVLSETTVPTSPLVTDTANGFFVEVGGNLNTGVAIANPNSQAATISFRFQDPEQRQPF